MRCHCCGHAADVEIESDDVIVGLCERHLRERIEALTNDGGLAALRDVLGIDDS